MIPALTGESLSHVPKWCASAPAACEGWRLVLTKRLWGGQVEQCANGAAYCQIVDAIYPVRFIPSVANWGEVRRARQGLTRLDGAG